MRAAHLQLVAGQGVQHEVNSLAMGQGFDHVLEGGVAAVANVVWLQAWALPQQELAFDLRATRGEHLRIRTWRPDPLPCFAEALA